MPSDKSDALNTETRVRRALGLAANAPPLQQQHSDQTRPRHRFVRDGEVPVVVLSGDGRSDTSSQADNRIADLEAALHVERAARASTTRSLEEARATIQSLQTRLAHAELAFDEALAAERRARAEAEKALQEAAAGGRAADLSEGIVGRSAAPAATRPRVERVRTAATSAKPKAASKQREPQPVKWWTPSYRAKMHTR